MDASALTRDDLRAILRASEGIPSQVSKAREQDGTLSPSTYGHAVAWHVHSAALTDEPKTKFRSFDDMVEALYLVCQSPMAIAHLRGLEAGKRLPPIRVEVNVVLPFQAEIADAQGPSMHLVTFSAQELRDSGRTTTDCLAIFEGRERAGTLHLQMHTFYPKVSKPELVQLLASVRSRPWR